MTRFTPMTVFGWPRPATPPAGKFAPVATAFYPVTAKFPAVVRNQPVARAPRPVPAKFRPARTGQPTTGASFPITARVQAFPPFPASVPASRRGECGSVTLLTLALVLVLIAIGVAAIDVAVIVATRAKVQAAADLAALGALIPATAPPRSVAQEVAAGNGASLVDCACGPESVTVTVERSVRLPLLGRPIRLPASSRAVLATEPLFPSPVEPSERQDRSGHVDPDFPAGGGAATVRALLASPRLELTAQARADLAGGVVDRRLVAILAAAVRRHRLAISVFRTGHSRYVAGTSVVSKHTYGRAMDVYKVDGGLVRSSHAPSRDLVTWLASLGPGQRPSEVGSPFPDFDSLEGHFSDRAHFDHVHIAVG